MECKTCNNMAFAIRRQIEQMNEEIDGAKIMVAIYTERQTQKQNIKTKFELLLEELEDK